MAMAKGLLLVLSISLTLVLARDEGSPHFPRGSRILDLGVRSSSRKRVKRALFVFGDSTVDTGNNNYFTTWLNASRDPYGIDYIPRSGRFCNGRIVTDFLGQCWASLSSAAS